MSFLSTTLTDLFQKRQDRIYPNFIIKKTAGVFLRLFMFLDYRKLFPLLINRKNYSCSSFILAKQSLQ